MGAVTSTAFDLCSGAMRAINALEAGEPMGAQDQNDVLQALNDMLDSWSLDHLMVVASTENFVNFTGGQYQYTIGNAPGGTFTGTVTSGSAIITGVTVPSTLAVNAFLTSNQNLFPANVQVLSIGANTVTMTANAIGTGTGADTVTYGIPGNFYKDGVTGQPIARPLRITEAFTRITSSGNTGLDYPIDIITESKYTAIGYKGVPGPWPTALYYNPTYPLGNIYVYPNPSQAGTLHLWMDQVLSSFTSITQTVALPQGYSRAIKANLAIEIASEYGKTPAATLVARARESKAAIRNLNQGPAVTAFFDADIVRGKRNDAGWIMHGGFTP